MTTYWHMQIHPDDQSFSDENLYSILENKKIIGLGDWKEGQEVIAIFINKLEVNDIVAIKNGSKLIALVQVIGGAYRVDDDQSEMARIADRYYVPRHDDIRLLGKILQKRAAHGHPVPSFFPGQPACSRKKR